MVKCSKRLLFQKFAYPVFGSFYCYFFILLILLIGLLSMIHLDFLCLSFKTLMSVHLFTFGLSYFIKLQCFIKVRTLGCLINVRRTFINFKAFSHQYFLIRDRMFINFESIIAQTKIIVHFCKNYSGLRV